MSNQIKFYDELAQKYEIVPEIVKYERILRINKILKFLSNRKNLSILEIGSGTGLVTRRILAITKNSMICATDISPEMISKIKNTFKLIFCCVCDAHYLPFATKFDIIIASEVIEHLKYPVKALMEINTLLKREGILILTTPNKNSFLRKKSSSQPIDTWRSFEELKMILEKSKMQIVRWFTTFYNTRFFYKIFYKSDTLFKIIRKFRVLDALELFQHVPSFKGRGMYHILTATVKR